MKSNLEAPLKFSLTQYEDLRGSFCELFSGRSLPEELRYIEFSQDNLSCSRRGVIRGLHAQMPPKEQGKLVFVLNGEILDVVIPYRKLNQACDYARKDIFVLGAGDALWVPSGYLHGFCARSENTMVLYKVTAGYSPEHEVCVRFDDPDLAIDWGEDQPIVSEKDREGLSFQEFCGGL
jgi:dTDP-4-dehydrorhamnose 3,5-epimerase